MNVEQILLAISNPNDNELTIEGLDAAKSNWPVFYPQLEQLIEQFIADDTSLTEEQETIVFFGIFLLAELKYSPALAKCLELFARSDSYLTPIDRIFGDALTELTSTLFYNVADGNTQALSDYIVGGHQAMYGKASAMEAVFAQYEVGAIDKDELSKHVTRWLAGFVALPSTVNSFLLSALADSCIDYQLDDFKSQFIRLCDKALFDEDRFTNDEVKAWDNSNERKLIESGSVQTDFNVADTLKIWSAEESEDETESSPEEDSFEEFESLMKEGGLLADIMYNEQTILENSVPVSSLKTAGRNDPCPCGSGKKYKKCCSLLIH